MCIHLIKLQDKEINEIYKIKRTSEQYVGLIEDVLEDYNKIYKDYSDLVGIYLNEKIIGLVVVGLVVITVGVILTEQLPSVTISANIQR